LNPFVLTESELRAVTAYGVQRAYAKGVVVISEGDRSDSLYVILQGKVKIYASDSDGREVVFGTQGPRSYFGELILEEGPRSASVMTLEKSRFIVVPREQLLRLVAENPEIALNVMRKLITLVRELTAKVKSLALMDVYGRVARLLLDLAERREGTLVIEGHYTQQDLASRVGASREMVGRVLKDLADGGYLSMQRSRIVILRDLPERW
jgi:CRP/FNR family cyclic AMP-dependent transcriptional regulator